MSDNGTFWGQSKLDFNDEVLSLLRGLKKQIGELQESVDELRKAQNQLSNQDNETTQDKNDAIEVLAYRLYQVVINCEPRILNKSDLYKLAKKIRPADMPYEIYEPLKKMTNEEYNRCAEIFEERGVGGMRKPTSEKDDATKRQGVRYTIFVKSNATLKDWSTNV